MPRTKRSNIGSLNRKYKSRKNNIENQNKKE